MRSAPVVVLRAAGNGDASTRAVVLATIFAALIAGGAAILAAYLANRNAEKRAKFVRDHQRELDELTDLRNVADDAVVALWRLWGAYSALVHLMLPTPPPQVRVRYPGRSVVGGEADPTTWREAFDDLSSANMRLTMRGQRGAALAVPVSAAKDASQRAWNDIMLRDPTEERDDEGKKRLREGVAATSKAWRDFMTVAQTIFGGDLQVAKEADPNRRDDAGEP